jgi:5-formyltetrahydrofolate cyclo-ligase
VRRIVSHLARSSWLHPSRPIGLYAATGSEVATDTLIALAQRRHCQVYLPRIVDYQQHRMTFVRVCDRPLRSNRHGIPEPPMGRLIPARALSVVFVPVVGFDNFGTRLGSGAGYYDRLFSFRRHGPAVSPLLVGLAFSCQRLPRIERDAHDVPLDAVVSELGIVRFTAKEDHFP